MAKKTKSFDVEVVRISYSNKNIRVLATSVKEARRLAVEAACNLELNEHDAEYKTLSVATIT